MDKRLKERTVGMLDRRAADFKGMIPENKMKCKNSV